MPRWQGCLTKRWVLADLWKSLNCICLNLPSQEEDDFYKTTYGGFSEEGDDDDFNFNSDKEDEDVVDSDFSIDENEEVKSDPEADEESSRKKAKRAGQFILSNVVGPSRSKGFPLECFPLRILMDF